MSYFLQHGLGFSQQKLVELDTDIQGFNERINRMVFACAGLGQNPGQMFTDYDFPAMYGLLKSSLPPAGDHREEWFAQVYHIDFNAEFLIYLWEELGIIVCTILLPMSRLGAWLQVTEHLEKDPEGSLLFLTEGTISVFPGSLLHAGGFRTDVRGHPRIHGHVFMCPRGTPVPDIRQLQNHYFRIGRNDPQVVRIYPEEAVPDMRLHATRKVKILYGLCGL
jgi:hypothetical protein